MLLLPTFSENIAFGTYKSSTKILPLPEEHPVAKGFGMHLTDLGNGYGDLRSAGIGVSFGGSKRSVTLCKMKNRDF